MISWLFEIDTLRLSTKDVTWSATEYSGLIIADSFSGITMRWNIAGNGLIAPNEMTFDVSNPGGTSSIGDFEGEFCTVRLIEDDSNTRTWKFKIERAISYYDKITCYCVDFLQEHLVGDYPNTKAPKEIWPSSDAEDTDDYCVPVILGTAYIPVRSVNTATERYYILGEDITPLEYTVDEVMSPHAWPNSSTWAPPTYDMDTSVASGYQLLQPKIDESVTPPATGLWPSGDSFYDMLCKYSRADTALITNPADWTEYVLEDFGVAGADIDSTTFAAAAIAYGAVSFDGGGWWRKEPRERVLSNLLAQTDSFLKCTDKVEIHQFSADPVETITDALLLSFSPSKVTKAKNDSGRVHWPESATKPSDILTGTTVVPTHGGVGATENTPSSEILECKFLAGDSVSAQKAGILYFQKKFEQSQRINFSVTFSTLTTKATLTPGQVVTVNNSLYGGSNNVIITDMTINPDMRVDFTGVVLNYLEDWGDLTPAAIAIVEDTSTGFISSINSAMVSLYKRNDPITTQILTYGSPIGSVSANEVQRIYGTSGADTLNIASGANVECTNFPGENIINIDSDFYLFSFYRSGTVVTFNGYDGTSLKIPATSSEQTINFNDVSYVLKISAGQVLLGATEVTTAKKYYPGLQVGLTEVLTSGSPDYTVPTNRYAHIYGTSGANEITLNIGSKAEVTNSVGANNFIFPANFAGTAEYRSGTVVTIWDVNGTVLKIPATTTIQTIQFNDTTVSLLISGNVLVINENPVPLLVSGGSPDVPTSISTYNFTTGMLSGHNNEWYQNEPDGDGALWKITAMANSLLTVMTDDIEPDEWSDPVKLSSDDLPVYQSIVINLFQRSETLPVTTDIADPVVYTHANGLLTGDTGAWSRDIPSGNSPLYVTSATTTSNFSSDEIGQAEWVTPVIMAQGGTNTATIYLYQRKASVPAVTDIADPVTYTFADRTIAESIGAWSREVPAGTDPIYIISAVASAKTETDTIARSEWSTPVILAENGEDGTNGTNGTNGEDATNWSSTLTFTSASASQISWAAGGYIYHSGGTETAINAGSKSSMSGTTTWYIYFDGTATLVATATASNAVGAGKILVAVARYGANGATFQAFGGKGGMLIAADEIAANSITANKIDVSDLFSNTISVTGNFTFYSDLNYIYFGTTMSSTRIYGNTTNLFLKTGGNLVISDEAAMNKFEIIDSSGSIAIQAASASTSDIDISCNRDLTLSAQRDLVLFASAGDIIFNTNDLYIDTSASRVGIGTTAPGYTLDVDGDIRCQTGHYFRGDGSLLTGLPSGGSTYYAGNGLTLSTTTFSLTTPGTLSGSTTNSSSGNHTHAVTGLSSAVTHASSNGSNHSYINQNVTTTGSPTFSSAYIANNIYHSGDSDTAIQFITDNIYFTVGNTLLLDLSEGSSNYVATNCDLVPYSNGVYDLGWSTLKWDNIYLVNDPIVGSDEKEKSFIQESDLGLDFIKELQPKKWIWNGKTRPHYGLVAQDVETKMQKDGFDFAGLVKSNHTRINRIKKKLTEEESKSITPPKEEIVVRTEQVKPDDEIIESFDSYGLRYGEFIGPIIKAIQEIDARLVSIENQLRT